MRRNLELALFVSIKNYFMNIEYLLQMLEDGRTLIFDLDDTLYPETDFLFQAYRHICISCYGSNSNAIVDFMTDRFLSHGRQNLFDETLQRFPNEDASVERFLTLLRTFQCVGKLEPFDWFRIFASRVPESFVLRIITDGNVFQQRNKLFSLDMGRFCSAVSVVYTQSFLPKPSQASLSGFRDRSCFVAPVYIGNSEVDKQFAENCGFEFVCVGGNICRQ